MSDENSLSAVEAGRSKVREIMLADGWTYGRRSGLKEGETRWYKYFQTEFKCYHNQKPQGIPIGLLETLLHTNTPPWIEVIYSLDIRAEATNAAWIDFQFYSLRADDILTGLGDMTRRLVAAWEAANTVSENLNESPLCNQSETESERTTSIETEGI